MRARWQLFIVITLILAAIFASTNTNRFLSKQEASQTEFTQKRLASIAQQIIPTVEAESPQRLQLQTREYNIAVICDTATGNLLYQADPLGGIHSSWSITVVPNGCQKNPR